MNEYRLSVDWEVLLQEANTIEDNWTVFKNEVISATKRFIPTCVNKSRNYKFCWWTKSLAVATRRKQELFLKFKQTHNNADYCKYAHQRNLTKAKIREAQRNYEKSLVDNLHVNPRPFYSYIKSKQKVKDTF